MAIDDDCVARLLWWSRCARVVVGAGWNMSAKMPEKQKKVHTLVMMEAIRLHDRKTSRG